MNAGNFEQSLIASGHARLPVVVDKNAFVPAQYEEAIRLLIVCQTLDEARTFDNLADALAAWARMYQDDRAAHAARVLKLHAYRRVGVLAQKIRPAQASYRGAKGPHSLLVESGMKNHQALAAMKVSRMPQKDFDSVTAQRRPPSPAMLAQVQLRKNPGWARLATRFAGLVSALRKGGLADVAASMDKAELEAAGQRCDDAIRLIGKFKHHINQCREKKVA